MQVDCTRYEADRQQNYRWKQNYLSQKKDSVRLVSSLVERLNHPGAPHLCSTLRKVFIFMSAIAHEPYLEVRVLRTRSSSLSKQALGISPKQKPQGKRVPAALP